ncbi:hypothetical protein EXIGLDRAFT_735479, partial [Exidia glandulosa HHB12029]
GGGGLVVPPPSAPAALGQHHHQHQHHRTRSYDTRPQPRTRRSHTSLSSSASSDVDDTAVDGEGDVRSHAQASALVEQTRAALLELPDDAEVEVDLEAQLAQLGKRLEIEKRFARGEAQRKVWGLREEEREALSIPTSTRARGRSAAGVGVGSSTPPRLPSTTPPVSHTRLPLPDSSSQLLTPTTMPSTSLPTPPISLAVEPPEPSPPMRARTPDEGWSSSSGIPLSRVVTAPTGHARRDSGGGSGSGSGSGFKHRLGGGLKRVFGKAK